MFLAGRGPTLQWISQGFAKRIIKSHQGLRWGNRQKRTLEKKLNTELCDIPLKSMFSGNIYLHLPSFNPKKSAIHLGNYTISHRILCFFFGISIPPEKSGKSAPQKRVKPKPPGRPASATRTSPLELGMSIGSALINLHLLMVYGGMKHY